MSTAILNVEPKYRVSYTPKHLQKSRSASFYGKRFKALRVAKDLLLSLIASIGYKILSTANWAIRRRLVHERYRELAIYNWNRGFNRLNAYRLFQDQVMHFSTNSTGKPKMSGQDEAEQLRQIYGNRLEEMRLHANQEELPIPKENLSLPSIRQGICLGESLDFLGRFLKLYEKNGLWFQNVEEVGRLFEEKGSEEAQITQILANGQNVKKFSEEMASNREKILDEVNEKREATLKKIDEKCVEFRAKYKFRGGDSLETIQQKKENFAKEIAKIKEELEEELKKLRFDVYRRVHLFEAELDLQKFRPLAALHSVQLDLMRVLIDEEIEKKSPPQKLAPFLKELPTGPYLMTFTCDQGNKTHAVVFIKESEKSGYLFDPNYATLFLDGEEHAQKLWSLAKHYNPKGPCTWQIFSARLATINQN